MQAIQNMLPGLLHPPFSIGFVLPHEPQRVKIEKSGIPLTAVLHSLVQPDNAGLGILKYCLILRAVEDLTPDALHCGTHQSSFGIKIVVDGTNRHTAGGRHGANIDRRPPRLLDELTAGLQDLLFGCNYGIHPITSI